MPKESNRRRVNDVVCFSCDVSIEKCSFNCRSTVKPSQEVTSIKQPPVLKGHLFHVPSYKIFILIEPLLRDHLS